MWEGKITRVIYTGENGFTIARLKTESEEITIVGTLFDLNEKDAIRITEGTKELHMQYGEQINVIRWEKLIPATVQGAIEFLSSPFVKGVGPKKARLIVKELGHEALQRIITEGPGLLETIPGVKKSAGQIYESIMANFKWQKVVEYLSPLGLPFDTIKKIYSYFGSDVLEIIEYNPYAIIKIHSVDFAKADQFALKKGIDKKSPIRVKAAIHYSIQHYIHGGGHCYMPENELYLSVARRLQLPRPDSMEPIQSALGSLLESKEVICENASYYLPQHYYAEKEIAASLARICTNTNSGAAKKVEAKISKHEKKNNIIFAPEQKEAIEKLFTTNVLLLTGGPGTGKTETIKAVTEIYKTISARNNMAVTAPTGRAARRMTELTGLEAMTIHRLLKIQPNQATKYNRENPLLYDLLIVDEASMLDIFIAAQLFNAIKQGTKVLLVGDHDQLPSVKPGNLLKDMLEAGVPNVCLQTIFRQAQESQIIINAHRVNNGTEIKTDPAKEDFFFIKVHNPQKVQDMVTKCTLRLVEKGYPLEEIQVLSPMKGGIAGINELNKTLQETFKNPDAKELSLNKRIFRQGDKVIQKENNYDKGVFNGDVGVIVKVGPIIDSQGDLLEKEGLHVKFNDRVIAYGKSELTELDLAYAITVHKSQGGEYRAVILALSMQQRALLARNLLYTGMTRAKDFLVLIGSDSAVDIALKNNSVAERNTGLAGKIKSMIFNDCISDAI